MNLLNNINNTAGFILENSKYKPEIGLILGSGLGELANSIKSPEFYKYEDLPNFPVSTVIGHEGQLVIGMLNDKCVMAMQGRFHYYEGYQFNEVTLPIRLMKLLGVETLIVTNAAGAVNESFKPGDLMIIKDQINFSGSNPLIGKNLDEFGPRFPDLSNAYTKDLVKKAKEVSKELNIDAKTGVYMMFSGPTYETPAEIRMARILGADAVGMSTVPEVIVAAHSGMNVLGISCITNMAAGILNQPLSHDEVMETSAKAKESFTKLVNKIIEEI